MCPRICYFDLNVLISQVQYRSLNRNVIYYRIWFYFLRPKLNAFPGLRLIKFYRQDE